MLFAIDVLASGLAQTGLDGLNTDASADPERYWHWLASPTKMLGAQDSDILFALLASFSVVLLPLFLFAVWRGPRRHVTAILFMPVAIAGILLAGGAWSVSFDCDRWVAFAVLVLAAGSVVETYWRRLHIYWIIPVAMIVLSVDYLFIVSAILAAG
jgi:hypothetical protein